MVVRVKEVVIERHGDLKLVLGGTNGYRCVRGGQGSKKFERNAGSNGIPAPLGKTGTEGPRFTDKEDVKTIHPRCVCELGERCWG